MAVCNSSVDDCIFIVSHCMVEIRNSVVDDCLVKHDNCMVMTNYCMVEVHNFRVKTGKYIVKSNNL